MKKRLLALALFYSVANADGCVLIQSNAMHVTWKAYKTSLCDLSTTIKMKSTDAN